jgi:hypothetical protein
MPKQVKRWPAKRDDGQLMIEVQPGQFVSETGARLGLFHPNLLAHIQRIKGRLQRPASEKPSKACGQVSKRPLAPPKRKSSPEKRKSSPEPPVVLDCRTKGPDRFRKAHPVQGGPQG